MFIDISTPCLRSLWVKIHLVINSSAFKFSTKFLVPTLIQAIKTIPHPIKKTKQNTWLNTQCMKTQKFNYPLHSTPMTAFFLMQLPTLNSHFPGPFYSDLTVWHFLSSDSEFVSGVMMCSVCIGLQVPVIQLSPHLLVEWSASEVFMSPVSGELDWDLESNQTRVASLIFPGIVLLGESPGCAPY